LRSYKIYEQREKNIKNFQSPNLHIDYLKLINGIKGDRELAYMKIYKAIEIPKTKKEKL